MKNKKRDKCSHMPDKPDNAERSVKCKQCGNMVNVSDMSSEGMVSCPVCGLSVSSWDTLKSEVSNEDY
jgi:ribosomal protein S27E